MSGPDQRREVPPGPAPSRRRFLGTAAGTAGAVTAGVIAGCTSRETGARPAPRASVIRLLGTKAENALPGERDWWIRQTGSPGEIDGFTGQASVRQGEPVTLYVSTTAREFCVVVLRMGWYGGLLARRVWHSGLLRGHIQPHYAVSPATRTVSCSWEPSLTMQTYDWPEGSYLIRLDASSGGQRYVPLTVRSFSTAGKVVLKNAASTWQAYNAWGGYDLQAGPHGYHDRSYAVSFDRPYDGKGADLFLAFERKLVNLAEKLGLPLAYASSVDLDREPHMLHEAAALISMGHDEYWSARERAHVTTARDAGVNTAFFGANAMFRRTRMAPTKLGPERLVISYPDPDPDSSLTGALYESSPATADYVVVSPDSWVFAGTGARTGSRLKGLVGDGYDRVNPRYPVPRPIEVLSHSPLTCRGVHSYADSAYYTHSGGAGVFAAGTMRWVQSLAPPFGRELIPGNARFSRRVTRNVLRAFSQGPAANRYKAKDNLAAMHEWPGDPIAAHHNLWPPVVR
jgi:hypothetical protein